MALAWTDLPSPWIWTLLQEQWENFSIISPQQAPLWHCRQVPGEGSIWIQTLWVCVWEKKKYSCLGGSWHLIKLALHQRTANQNGEVQYIISIIKQTFYPPWKYIHTPVLSHKPWQQKLHALNTNHCGCWQNVQLSPLPSQQSYGSIKWKWNKDILPNMDHKSEKKKFGVKLLWH